MPPQIKQDLNRAGWESTDMPSVCERCLPDNPYVQMIKEEHGEACKICTRPFSLFKWKADRTARQKRTIICLTCARLKNCCQSCMLDLSFGLPITVRDAALKMLAPGPTSSINREFYAQNNEKAIQEGRGGLEAYDKTDEKARELLKRLAKSEPYRRTLPESESAPKALPAPATQGPGPIRTSDVQGKIKGRRRPFPPTAQLGPREEDWIPPQDATIKSLFVVGVEDDLAEYKIRDFFSEFGTLQSVVCSHRAHCAYINYVKREAAEKAADACHGKAVIAGCPLRVTWGKPKQLDNMDENTRDHNARAGRLAVGATPRELGKVTAAGGNPSTETANDPNSMVALAPPGEDDVQYRSMVGE